MHAGSVWQAIGDWESVVSGASSALGVRGAALAELAAARTRAEEPEAVDGDYAAMLDWLLAFGWGV